MLMGVHNFSVKKMELDAKDSFYYTSLGFQNLLASHGKNLGIPSYTVQRMLNQMDRAWSRCFKKVRDEARIKGTRNKQDSILLPNLICVPGGNYVKLPGIGKLRFHKQVIPVDSTKCACIIAKHTSDWYLSCLLMQSDKLFLT